MIKPAAAMTIAFVAMGAAASAQVPAGPEFRVNTYTTGHQLRARVAMERDGDFIVVWQSNSQVGIFGQRFAASGARRGGEFRIDTVTTTGTGAPHVAVGSRGDFVVVWLAYQPSIRNVRGQRFDATGGRLGGEFQVNTYTSGYLSWPHVGRASDGAFVVSWASTLGDGSADGIAARRFDAWGNPIGSQFVVNTYTTGRQVRGDLAVAANGDFVVVWEDLNGRDGSLAAIFGQRYDASGNRVGTEFQVNTYTTANQDIPSVSVSPAGGFVVAWASPDGFLYGVFARRFDASGNALGSDFAVNTFTTTSQYGYFGQVAHDGRGNFVVTWGGYGLTGLFPRIWAQRFTASGAFRGAEFRVDTYNTGQQRRPSVASDSVGNFVVSWENRGGQDGDLYGVFAQRFGGLGPAALVVDTTGNQVLEPGETVDVRPSWRNSIGAAQTFSATLANLAGPPGATYTLLDGAGDYGTVANGTTAPCTNCYTVSVSNPATRPATHWDASAVESILPDTQGQQKQWLLHIGRSFTDVPTTSGFYRFIETLLHNGVTGGCNATQYCPSTSTTRDQMAVFVLVAKEGTGYVPPACTTPVFADVPASSPFCRWIEELARRGVVGGCGGGNYCPSASATREKMAVFVLRTLDPALNPPACGTPMFADVPATSGFCRWIEELTRRNVVSGCGGGNYCPTASVTREQMGVFISVTFSLTLYGP